MVDTFRADPEHARYGCLMVNTLGELGSDEAHSALAGAYRNCFRDAFGTALSQAAARSTVSPRASLLTAMTMGLFIAAR